MTDAQKPKQAPQQATGGEPEANSWLMHTVAKAKRGASAAAKAGADAVVAAVARATAEVEAAKAKQAAIEAVKVEAQEEATSWAKLETEYSELAGRYDALAAAVTAAAGRRAGIEGRARALGLAVGDLPNMVPASPVAAAIRASNPRLPFPKP